MATFIAGPYTTAYNSNSLGQAEDGLTLSFTHFDEQITGDNFAEAVQELITRGVNAYLSATLLDYSAAGIQGLIWPSHGTFGTIGQVGRVSGIAIGGVTIAKSMVLTAVAGTTASSTPATLTLALCRLAPGFPVNLLFAPRLRRVPFQVQSLPSAAGVLFAVT